LWGTELLSDVLRHHVKKEILTHEKWYEQNSDDFDLLEAEAELNGKERQTQIKSKVQEAEAEGEDETLYSKLHMSLNMLRVKVIKAEQLKAMDGFIHHTSSDPYCGMCQDFVVLGGSLSCFSIPCVCGARVIIVAVLFCSHNLVLGV
jgi:hypothetical protein